MRFHLGKEKKSLKKQTKKHQVLTPLTGSSLLHLLHLSGHGRPESLQQQLHAGQWLYRAEAGTRHLWACVSKMAHGHTSSLDKGKVNTRLSRGWSFTDPSQAKHHSSKPSQEISTMHCTCFCLEPSPAPSSCVGRQQGDAQPSVRETVKGASTAQRPGTGRPALAAALGYAGKASWGTWAQGVGCRNRTGAREDVGKTDHF